MILVATRRTAELVLTLFVASLVVFGALYLVPGGPIAYLVHGQVTTPQTVARITAEYHLNEPFVPRYWQWLTGLFQGNFGTSLIYHESASALIADSGRRAAGAIKGAAGHRSSALVRFLGVG